MTKPITDDHTIAAVARAWTTRSADGLVQAVEALLAAGRYDETTVQAVAVLLEASEGSAVRSAAIDLAGSIRLSPQAVPSEGGYNVEVFAIPLTGTGNALAHFGRDDRHRHAWAAAMKRHGLVACHARICILPRVWCARDMLAMTPQMIRNLGVAMSTALIAGQDMTRGPVPDLAPLGAGIQGGPRFGAGVALAVVVDGTPDDGQIDPLRAHMGYDTESRVAGPVPGSVDRPALAWTAAWTSAGTGRRPDGLRPLPPVSIGDAMAAAVEAEILTQTARAGAGADDDVVFVLDASDVGGLTVEALVDGRPAMTWPIDPALFAACGSALRDRLDPVPGAEAPETRLRTLCSPTVPHPVRHPKTGRGRGERAMRGPRTHPTGERRGRRVLAPRRPGSPCRPVRCPLRT